MNKIAEILLKAKRGEPLTLDEELAIKDYAVKETNGTYSTLEKGDEELKDFKVHMM